MNSASILWRRLDLPGHEAARLVSQPAGWLLTGAAGFVTHYAGLWQAEAHAP